MSLVRCCAHLAAPVSTSLRSLAAIAVVAALAATAAPQATHAQNGYVAAIAYSPKTGKIGSTAGAARTKKEAHEIALKECDAPDAKVFMWGPEWVAIATVDGRPGIAGFAPGATREIAERAALDQAEKLSRGGKCQVALAIHAAGDPKAKPAAAAEKKPTASTVSTTAPATP